MKAATEIVSGTLDNARTSGTASATASTLVLRDGSGGASFGYVAANNQWAYLDPHFQSLECGTYQTVGGPFEYMAKYSEDFTVATWDKNGGSSRIRRTLSRRLLRRSRRHRQRQRLNAAFMDTVLAVLTKLRWHDQAVRPRTDRRRELRETNALLLLILRPSPATTWVTGKDGLMPHLLPVQ